MKKKDKNQENLEQLLKEFFADDQAGQVAEDIDAGQEILHLYPAPQPQAAVLDDIKADIAEALAHKKTILFRPAVYYKAVAVAAVLIIAAIISLRFVAEQNYQHKEIALIPAKIWESTEIAADDEELAILAAKIEQIEDEFADLQVNGYSDSYSAVAELEMELIELNSDFWKG